MMRVCTPLVPLLCTLLLVKLGACTERYGGMMVIGIAADVADVSPLTANFQTALYMQQFLLFLPLIAYDEALQPVPRLARSWELSPDSTLLTLRLRDDVHWHDGVKTTAHDLHFSYERARGAQPDTRGDFVGIERWWIHPARR